MKSRFLLGLLLLAACSEKEELPAPQPAPPKPQEPTKPVAVRYTLSFELENERPTGMHLIQVAKENNNFITVDSLPFDPAKNGTYSYSLHLVPGEQARVVSRTTDTTLVSSALLAN